MYVQKLPVPMWNMIGPRGRRVIGGVRGVGIYLRMYPERIYETGTNPVATLRMEAHPDLNS